MAAKSQHFGRDGLVFLQLLPKAADSDFVPIVQDVKNIESGSLTQKDGAMFSLTARELQKYKIAPFFSSGAVAKV